MNAVATLQGPHVDITQLQCPCIIKRATAETRLAAALKFVQVLDPVFVDAELHDHI